MFLRTLGKKELILAERWAHNLFRKTSHGPAVSHVASTRSVKLTPENGHKIQIKQNFRQTIRNKRKKIDNFGQFCDNEIDLNQDKPTWTSRIQTHRLYHFGDSGATFGAQRTWTREAASLLPRTIDGSELPSEALENYQTRLLAVPTWKTESRKWQ